MRTIIAAFRAIIAEALRRFDAFGEFWLATPGGKRYRPRWSFGSGEMQDNLPVFGRVFHGFGRPGEKRMLQRLSHSVIA
jgi:hypothetical protein